MAKSILSILPQSVPYQSGINASDFIASLVTVDAIGQLSLKDRRNLAE